MLFPRQEGSPEQLTPAPGSSRRSFVRCSAIRLHSLMIEPFGESKEHTIGAVAARCWDAGYPPQ